MASVVITDIYRVNKASLSSVSSQRQVQSNIHKQSKTYLFELRGCLLTNTRETSVSSTGNNETTKHFKRPPVPRYRWCMMPGCSSWEHRAKTLPFKLKRWLSLSKRVCSSHSGVLSLVTSLAKKNPDPLVGQSASSCWVAKKKEKKSLQLPQWQQNYPLSYFVGALLCLQSDFMLFRYRLHPVALNLQPW